MVKCCSVEKTNASHYLLYSLLSMEKQHLYAVLLESKKLFSLQKQQVEQFNRQFHCQTEYDTLRINVILREVHYNGHTVHLHRGCLKLRAV